ncbi:MAG: hypothetical protein AAGD09_11535 [Cyanobacteria bacterium P01_F01_bin.56]
MSQQFLYWGIDQIFSATVDAPATGIDGATFRFDIGLDFRQNPIQTVLNDDITASIAEGKLTFSLPINGAALVSALGYEGTHTLNWQLRITLSGSSVPLPPIQGSVQVKPSFGETVVIVGTPTVQGQLLTGPAGAALSALRVVVADDSGLAYADKDTPAHAAAAIGLTTQSAAQGDTVNAPLVAVVNDAGWNWDATLPIWLGNSGQLTQVAPSNGFSRQVATVLFSDTIFFEPQEAILL